MKKRFSKKEKQILAEIVCQMLNQDEKLLEIATETVRLDSAYKIFGVSPMEARNKLTENKTILFSTFLQNRIPFKDEKQMMEIIKMIQFE